MRRGTLHATQPQILQWSARHPKVERVASLANGALGILYARVEREASSGARGIQERMASEMGARSFPEGHSLLIREICRALGI